MFTVSSLCSMFKIWAQVVRLGFEKFTVQIVFLRAPWTKALCMRHPSGKKLLSRSRLGTAFDSYPILARSISAWKPAFFNTLYYCKEKYTYQWNKLVFPRSAAIVSAVSTSSCFTFTRNLIDFPAFFLFGRNWVRGRWYGSVSPIRRHQIARINTPDGGAPKRSSSHSDHSQSHLAGKTIFLGSYAGLVMIF